MTQHYKDTNNNIYGYKPDGIEVIAITMAEVPQINESKITPEQRKQMRISEIDAELTRLDTEAIRPLRAIQAGTQTAFDVTKLADLDLQASTLRTERASLVETI